MKYTTREQWRARPAKAVTTLPWTKVDTIFVHYTAAESDRTEDAKARMRGVQNFHIDNRGWNDFAYSWAFSFTGEILEGRGWGVYTAATGVENNHSYAVVFLGADKIDRDDLTVRGRNALGEVLREAERLKGKKLIVKGHTEAQDPTGKTACPGAEILAFIKLDSWRINFKGYPKHFFDWASWRLGEGIYKPYGPANPAVRPEYPKKPIGIIYWIALQRFLQARKKNV